MRWVWVGRLAVIGATLLAGPAAIVANADPARAATPARGASGVGALLAQASRATAAAKTASISLTTSTRGVDRSTATGWVDFPANYLRLTMRTTLLSGSASTTSASADVATAEVVSGSKLYLRDNPTRAKSWEEQTAPGLAANAQYSQDPTKILARLGPYAVGVRGLGRSEIGGVSTTGYAVTISPRSPNIDQIPPLSALGYKSVRLRVWLDGRRRVRRLSETVVLTANPSLTEDVEIDLADFGRPVALTHPPASQVTKVP